MHRCHDPGHDAGETDRAGHTADPESLGFSLAFDRKMERDQGNPGQEAVIEPGEAEGKEKPTDTGKQQPMRARGVRENHRSYRSENVEGMQPTHNVRK